MKRSRYRVERITITPLGTVLIFVAAILIGLSALTARLWVAYAGVGIAALVLYSLAYARFSAASLASQVSVDRLIDDYVVEGYPVWVRLRLVNPRLMHIGPLIVEEVEPKGVRVLDRIGLIPLIPPRGVVETSYRVVSRIGKRCYRGIRYRGWDPLGLFEFKVTSFKRRVECIRTMPLLLPVSDRVKSRGTSTLEGAPAIKMRGLETYQLREYTSGDDARLIEWKATARLGQLIVRETLSEASGNYSILVICDSRGWKGSWLQTPCERGIRLAVSIARELALSGVKVVFQVTTPDGSWKVEGSKSDVVSRILKLIADIPEPDSAFEDKVEVRLPGIEGLVVTAGPQVDGSGLQSVRVIDATKGDLGIEQVGSG